jgi:tetratricopeptide (TPR) repeat protein
MKVTWLHVSDFHIRGGDPYDRDVVLKALVSSVKDFRERGRAPDLVLATDDVAYSGKADEYELATKFFDDLLSAAGLEKQRLFVVPGNHDVDQDLGVGLARTLGSREEADAYFKPAIPKIHLTQKQGAFLRWYNGYFAGIRALPEDSTCGPVEAIGVREVKIGILPLNSALFCQDDYDHAKLWIGRRCLGAAIEKLQALAADVDVALVHHPLDWLHGVERSNIRAGLRAAVDLVLRGHLHETDIETVASASGGVLHCAAGAAYQTRRWPNGAAYATIEGGRLTVFPIRYEDRPREVWAVDPSLFPSEDNYEKSFPIPRLAEAGAEPRAVPPPRPPERAPAPRFHSNIPSRRNLPFVGREDLLNKILKALGEASREGVLVLHGLPGVGKSELAREFARRQFGRYPAGTFFVDAAPGAAMVELARIGRNFLSLDYPPDLPLQDQGLQALVNLGASPALLIYDNVHSAESVQPWLPPAGMPCHVLITTVMERWGPGWLTLEVKPLSDAASLELIERLAGRQIADQYGRQLVALAGGLPAQIAPAALTLAYEARRGRLDLVRLALTPEAEKSFSAVYERLEPPVRLLLHAAAFLNCQRLPRDELYRQLEPAMSWSQAEFHRLLDACLDVHLLEGGAELRMHQLFADFLRGAAVAAEDAVTLQRVRLVQRGRLVEMAKELAAHPANTELAAVLTVFPLRPEPWEQTGADVAIDDGETIGRALCEIGRFNDAPPWFRKAVEAKQKGDVHGRVDHESLGVSLHLVGYCLSSTGKFDEARVWYERAVEATERGDVHGRVDHESLGRSLHQVGYCLSRTGKFDEARAWYERAVEAKEKGDAQGRVNHASLGKSLHLVGYCLSSIGKFDEARAWCERAVGAHEKGDVHGRVDHESLGKSLHQVGDCLSETGKFDEARLWYERAVEAKQKGDVQGRVDHDSLGRSLHQVGYCLSEGGKFDEARVWYERAVEAAEKGDAHGRVDHAGVAVSMRKLARCLRELGQLEEAKQWEGKASDQEKAARQSAASAAAAQRG